MLESARHRRQSLGAGGADVKALIDVAEFGAIDHAESAEVVGGQGQYRHDHMPQVGRNAVRPRYPARRRQPAQFNGKQEDQRNADKEIRHRNADQIGDNDDSANAWHVWQAVETDSGSHRQQDRPSGQLERHRKRSGNRRADRILRCIGAAKIAGQGLTQPTEILDVGGTIEAEACVQLRNGTGARVLTKHHRGRAAEDGRDAKEQERGQNQQRGNGKQNAADRHCQHLPNSIPRAGPWIPRPMRHFAAPVALCLIVRQYTKYPFHQGAFRCGSAISTTSRIPRKAATTATWSTTCGSARWPASAPGWISSGSPSTISASGVANCWATR